MTLDDVDVSLIGLYAAHHCVNRSLQHANFKKWFKDKWPYIIVNDIIACFCIGNSSQGSIICCNMLITYGYQQLSELRQCNKYIIFLICKNYVSYCCQLSLVTGVTYLHN